MEITLDDSSPLFKYSGRWVRQHDTDDQTRNYFEQTYYSTNNEGNSVSLTFNGTGITVYGSKRRTHVRFTSQMDNAEIVTSDGHSTSPLFQQVLYSSDSLSADQEHTLVLTNTPSSGPDNAVRNTLDIDYAVIKTATTGTIYSSIIDDASFAISYTGNNWVRGAPSDDYYATTRMVSKDAGDVMQFNFSGTSIQLFGAINFDHGNHSVVIDKIETPNNIYNGSFWMLKPQATLFMANNLPDGPHTLTLTNVGQGKKGNMLDFDYAIVNTTIGASTNGSPVPSKSASISASGPPISTSAPSSSGTSDIANENSNSSEKSSSSTNTGAIAGGVVGGIIGAALVALLAWFLLKRRKGKDDESSVEKYVTRKDSKMDLTGEEVQPYHDQTQSQGQSHNGYFAYSTLPPADNSSYHDTTPGNQSQSQARTQDRSQFQIQLPYLSAIPMPPGSNATSYPASSFPPSSTADTSETNQSQISSPWPQGPPSTAFTHNTFGVPSTRDRVGVSRSDPIDEEDQAANTNTSRNEKSRLNLVNHSIVNGREQDMGPHNPDSPTQKFATLPPDYQQATQHQNPPPNPSSSSS